MASFIKEADIVVSAVGKPELVTKDMVKEGAVIIDVGNTPDENGKLKGDVAFDEVKEVASAITPVPGGVGPLTITMVLNNTLLAEKMRRGIE
ncbi:bifunctional 5%2C10-methylene-tetrahydrofolate dehydrogenase/ 5%2C10-methylene-tetrahydrofolate cyclohydrolase [Streptococcus pneumoniae]|nr:bifunctional 5%2C10-methylene-tetrahydrofolate dehydrogenase/ 5%2C10-methylene-tetrahydrofolate cyclohydrolase [Streptococcus pneumoniae]